MNSIKIGLWISFFLCICGSVIAQDSMKTNKVKPFELGLTIGSPELISIQGKCFLPYLNNHVAVGVKGGWFKINSLTSVLWGINIDYYIKNSSKGLYVGAEFLRNSLNSNNPDNPGISEGLVYTTTIDYTYYYKYYGIYTGYSFVWKKFYINPELGIDYSYKDNYVLETVIINNKLMSVTEPLNPQLKKYGIDPLFRLSFGYRF